MKKLTIVICVLATVLALTGVASASRPEPATFTITGYTPYWEFGPLPSGRIRLHLTAEGAPGAVCKEYFGKKKLCGISGYFEGTFTFDERVTFDPDSGLGKNHGIMTITTAEGDVAIRFKGKTDSETVWGKFKVLHKEGTGVYQDLHGKAKYTGNAGLVFTVDFTGRFHTHPR